MIKHLAARMRPPRLGKIRLGIKKISASGREYPAEVPYFVLPPEVAGRFPIEPTELDVMFPFNDVDEVLVTEYVRYQGSGGKGGGLLTLRCDGERFLQIPKDSREATLTGPCRRPYPPPGERIPACDCEATARGRLRVILIKGPVGYYEIK
jgi:Recombination directionality factor-like